MKWRPSTQRFRSPVNLPGADFTGMRLVPCSPTEEDVAEDAVLLIRDSSASAPNLSSARGQIQEPMQALEKWEPSMAINYFIDEERSMVIGIGSGYLPFSDLKSEEDRLRSDPKFKSNLNQLLDVREVTAFEMSTNQARLLAGSNPFSARSRRAFVVGKEQAFGMGRMFQSFVELSANPAQGSVFYDVGDALNWLGL